MMATFMNSNTKKKAPMNDDFDRYLDKLRVCTTFNGTEIADFSIYKKFLGLK